MIYKNDFCEKQLIFFNSVYGNIINFKNDNIVIKDKYNKVILQHSCYKVMSLIIIGNISFTNIVLKKAKKFGFPINEEKDFLIIN